MSTHLATRRRRAGAFGIAGALALASAAAQESGRPTGEQSVPLYRVEVIVFAYNEADPAEEAFVHSAARAASRDGKAVPGDVATFEFGPLLGPAGGGAAAAPGGLEPGGPLPGAATAPGENEPGAAAGEPSESGGPGATAPLLGVGDDPLGVDPLAAQPDLATAPFRFWLLREDELTLTDARRRLERLDAYTPLVHGGWIQEGLPQDEAHAFDLGYLGTRNPAGTFRLYVNRFLHVNVELDYRPAGFRVGGVPAGRAGASQNRGASADSSAFEERADPFERRNPFDEQAEPRGRGPLQQPGFGFAEPSLSELEVAPRYTLRADRRMRSGEIHYIDHPYFGVIIVVRPYEPEQPAPQGGVRPAA